MKTDRGISVLLPIYLRSRSARVDEEIERALRSIYLQKFDGPFEVLVLDDGSPEVIANLLQDLGLTSLEHLKIIRIAQHSGLVYALNLGLNLARFDTIARLDADDTWRHDKIEKQLRQWRNDPDLTILGTGMCLNYSNGEPPCDIIRPGSWQGVLQFMRDQGCPFPHGSILARTKIMRLLGGYPHDSRFTHCEDFATWGVLLRFFKAGMIEEVLYDYTVSTASVSHRHSEQQRRASGLVHQTFLQCALPEQIPQQLAAISRELRISISEAGVLSFLVWRHPSRFKLSPDIRDLLAPLLRDRWLHYQGPNHIVNDSSAREVLSNFWGCQGRLSDRAPLPLIDTEEPAPRRIPHLVTTGKRSPLNI